MSKRYVEMIVKCTSYDRHAGLVSEETLERICEDPNNPTEDEAWELSYYLELESEDVDGSEFISCEVMR